MHFHLYFLMLVFNARMKSLSGNIANVGRGRKVAVSLKTKATKCSGTFHWCTHLLYACLTLWEILYMDTCSAVILIQMHKVVSKVSINLILISVFARGWAERATKGDTYEWRLISMLVSQSSRRLILAWGDVASCFLFLSLVPTVWCRIVIIIVVFSFRTRCSAGLRLSNVWITGIWSHLIHCEGSESRR